MTQVTTSPRTLTLDEFLARHTVEALQSDLEISLQGQIKFKGRIVNYIKKGEKVILRLAWLARQAHYQAGWELYRGPTYIRLNRQTEMISDPQAGFIWTDGTVDLTIRTNAQLDLKDVVGGELARFLADEKEYFR